MLCCTCGRTTGRPGCEGATVGTAVLLQEQAVPLVLAGGRQVRSGCATVASAGDGPPATTPPPKLILHALAFVLSEDVCCRQARAHLSCARQKGRPRDEGGFEIGHPCHLKPLVASQIPLPPAPASHNPAPPQTQMHTHLDPQVAAVAAGRGPAAAVPTHPEALGQQYHASIVLPVAPSASSGPLSLYHLTHHLRQGRRQRLSAGRCPGRHLSGDTAALASLAVGCEAVKVG